MHSSKSLMSVAALVSAIALGASAQQPAAPPPAPHGTVMGGVVGAVETWKGIVLSVDQKTRHVVLRGMAGNLHAFTARKEGVDLTQVKPGDSVSVKYIESIAVYLREQTDPPVTASENTVTVQPTGLPAITDVTVKETDAEVTGVDSATRVLTLKTAQGNMLTVHVAPSVSAFSRVKVGDRIVIRASEALAVKVTRG